MLFCEAGESAQAKEGQRKGKEISDLFGTYLNPFSGGGIQLANCLSTILGVIEKLQKLGYRS